MGVGRLIAQGVALRAVGPFAARERYAKDDASGDRWITIGGEPNEEKGTKHEGGSAVKIDSEGRIKAGPKWLKDKGIDELSDFGDKGGGKKDGGKKDEKRPAGDEPGESGELSVAEMRKRFAKGQELDTPKGKMVSEGMTLGNNPVVRARDDDGGLHQFTVDELTAGGAEEQPLDESSQESEQDRKRREIDERYDEIERTANDSMDRQKKHEEAVLGKPVEPSEPEASEEASEPVAEQPEQSTEPESAADPPTIEPSWTGVRQFALGTIRGEYTADQLKQSFQSLRDSKEEFTAGIRKAHKKNQLLGILDRLGGFPDRSDRVGEIADKIHTKILGLHIPHSNSVRYDPFGGETYEDALAKQVESMTQEDLDKHYEEKQKKNEEDDRAVQNPESLEDFQKHERSVGGYENMTPENQARYDELHAERSRSMRAEESKKRMNVEQAEAANVEGFDMDIQEGFHTKHNRPVWYAIPNQRVDRDTYQDLAGKAKRLGGRWSRAYGDNPAGFQFNSAESAEQFRQLLSGNVDRSEDYESRQAEKAERNSDNLADVAERLQADAESRLNADRLDNTERRARMAASAEADARADLALAGTMANIANAISEGRAKFLDGVRTKSHVKTLGNVLQRTRRDMAYAEQKRRGGSMPYRELEQMLQEPTGEKHVPQAAYPYPRIHEDEFNRLVSSAGPGLKRKAARLAKSAAASDGTIEFTRPDDVETLGELLNSTGKHDHWWPKESLAEYRRMQAMNIRTPQELRSALREMVPLRGEMAKADPVKQAERALRGKKIPGFFPTPRKSIDSMLQAADIQQGDRVLEPSAGKGDILDAIRESHGDQVQLHGIEMSGDLRDVLDAKGHTVQQGDFLEHQGEYDKIVMNPPFENYQDVDHVRHAHSLLAPGGKVVAVMSASPFSNSHKKAAEFRDWLDSVGGTAEPMESGSFAGSDSFNRTGVSSYMVEIPKSKEGDPVKYSRNRTADRIARLIAIRGQVARYAKSDKESDGKANWITIGGEPDGKGKKHVGGTPVKVTDSGQIVAGPKALADKGIKNLSDFGKKGKGGGDQQQGGTKQEADRVGEKWDTPRGQKEIVGRHSDGRYLVSEPGSRAQSIMTEDEIDESKRIDSANTDFHKEQDKKTQERERAEAEERAKLEDTKGFGDDFSQMNKKRMLTQLGGNVKYNGQILSRKDWMEQLAERGFKVQDHPSFGRIAMNEDGDFLKQGDTGKWSMDYLDHLNGLGGDSGQPEDRDSGRPDIDFNDVGSIKSFLKSGGDPLEQARQAAAELMRQAYGDMAGEGGLDEYLNRKGGVLDRMNNSPGDIVDTALSDMEDAGVFNGDIDNKLGLLESVAEDAIYSPEFDRDEQQPEQPASEAEQQPEDLDDRITGVEKDMAQKKIAELNGDIEDAEYSLARAKEAMERVERDERMYDDPADYPYTLKDARKDAERKSKKAEKELKQARDAKAEQQAIIEAYRGQSGSEAEPEQSDQEQSLSTDYDSVPQFVKQKVEYALGRMEYLSEQMAQAAETDRRFGAGDGRYQSEVWDKIKGNVDDLNADLDKIRESANGKGIDGDGLIASIGQIPENLKPPADYDEWSGGGGGPEQPAAQPEAAAPTEDDDINEIAGMAIDDPSYDQFRTDLARKGKTSTPYGNYKIVPGADMVGGEGSYNVEMIDKDGIRETVSTGHDSLEAAQKAALIDIAKAKHGLRDKQSEPAQAEPEQQPAAEPSVKFNPKHGDTGIEISGIDPMHAGILADKIGSISGYDRLDMPGDREWKDSLVDQLRELSRNSPSKSEAELEGEYVDRRREMNQARQEFQDLNANIRNLEQQRQQVVDRKAKEIARANGIPSGRGANSLSSAAKYKPGISLAYNQAKRSKEASELQSQIHAMKEQAQKASGREQQAQREMGAEMGKAFADQAHKPGTVLSSASGITYQVTGFDPQTGKYTVQTGGVSSLPGQEGQFQADGGAEQKLPADILHGRNYMTPEDKKRYDQAAEAIQNAAKERQAHQQRESARIREQGEAAAVQRSFSPQYGRYGEDGFSASKATPQQVLRSGELVPVRAGGEDVISDGRFMLKASASPANLQKHFEKNRNGFSSRYSWDNPAKGDAVMESAAGGSPQPLSVVGYRSPMPEDAKGTMGHAYVTNGEGVVVIGGHYADYLSRNGYELHANSDAMSGRAPLLITKDGQNVGALMPMATEGGNDRVQSLESLKRQLGDKFPQPDKSRNSRRASGHVWDSYQRQNHATSYTTADLFLHVFNQKSAAHVYPSRRKNG